MEKKTFEKNKRESTIILERKNVKRSKNWTDDEIQLLLSSAVDLFSFLYIFAVVAVGQHH